MIPKQSSWPLHALLVELTGVLNATPEPVRKQATLKWIERCFRLGVKIASHFEVPGQATIAMMISAMHKDGGPTCTEAAEEFTAMIRNEAITQFKASIGYQEFASVQKVTAAVTSKGGDA